MSSNSAIVRNNALRVVLAASAAVAALVMPVAGRAQTAAEQRLLRLTEARVSADFTANRAALDSLLAPDLTYARSSGAFDDKRTVLAEVGPGGPYALDYLTPDSLRARAYGSTGVVTGLLRVKLKAQPSPYRIRFTDVWVERGGRWQLVAFQATRLP
ncbi:MAG: nuclear transport factor 2 family protein [Gemmatimonadaceae bacterium]|nr:nuclear transport factor 2 family protein [Gemmatimonadaceae bacterium]